MVKRQILWYKSSVNQLMSFNSQQIIKRLLLLNSSFEINVLLVLHLFDGFYDYEGYPNSLICQSLNPFFKYFYKVSFKEINFVENILIYF